MVPIFQPCRGIALHTTEYYFVFQKKNYLIVICYPFSLMLNDPVPHAIFFPSCKGLA